MIITQAPLRISFFGGGTDLKGFYALEEGCVLSSAIDKGIFAIIKQRFDARVRVGYTRTELVESIDDLWMLFYTNNARLSESIQTKQRANIDSRLAGWTYCGR